MRIGARAEEHGGAVAGVASGERREALAELRLGQTGRELDARALAQAGRDLRHQIVERLDADRPQHGGDLGGRVRRVGVHRDCSLCTCVRY